MSIYSTVPVPYCMMWMDHFNAKGPRGTSLVCCKSARRRTHTPNAALAIHSLHMGHACSVVRTLSTVVRSCQTDAFAAHDTSSAPDATASLSASVWWGLLATSVTVPRLQAPRRVPRGGATSCYYRIMYVHPLELYLEHSRLREDQLVVPCMPPAQQLPG